MLIGVLSDAFETGLFGLVPEAQTYKVRYAPPVRKIHKFLRTTRCHILRLKCTKFDFGWGSSIDPAGGAHSAPPDPLAGFKGSYF